MRTYIAYEMRCGYTQSEVQRTRGYLVVCVIQL